MNTCRIIRFYQSRIKLNQGWLLRFHRALAAATAHLAIAGYCLLIYLVGIVVASSFEFTETSADVAHLLIVIGCLFLWSVAYQEPDREPSKVSGLKITETDAPELFKVIREVKARFRIRRLHVVRIFGSANAAVQANRAPWTVFYKKRELNIGWGLLVALPPDELRFVIAHEIAHFQKENLRAPWWVRKADAAVSKACDMLTFAPCRWLFELIQAWLTAVLIFANQFAEMLADKEGLRIAGGESSRNALARISVLTTDSVSRSKRMAKAFLVESQAPPSNPLEIADRISLQPFQDQGLLEEEIRQQLKVISCAVDSHPATAERLQQFGVDSEGCIEELTDYLLKPVEPSACLLPNRGRGIRDRLQQSWVQQETAGWQQDFETGELLKNRENADWKKRANPQTGYHSDLWQHAVYALRKEGHDKFRLWLNRILQVYPDCSITRMHLAIQDIQYGTLDQIGKATEVLWDALRSDDDRLANHAFDSLSGFYSLSGDHENLEKVESHFNRVLSTSRKNERARKKISGRFRRSPISQRQLNELLSLLSQIPVSRLWMADKIITQAPSLTYRVVVVQPAPTARPEILDHVRHVLYSVFETDPAIEVPVYSVYGRGIVHLLPLLPVKGSCLWKPQTAKAHQLKMMNQRATKAQAEESDQGQKFQKP